VPALLRWNRWAEIPSGNGGVQHEELKTSYWSLVQSRNKELLAIDLRKPQGASLVGELAKAADIVIETFVRAV